MNQLKNVIVNEPVLISGLVEALIVLAVAFGVGLTTEQTGAILAVVAILTSLVARAFVTPTKTL